MLEQSEKYGWSLLKPSLRYDWFGDVAIGNGEDDHVTASVVETCIVAVWLSCIELRLYASHWSARNHKAKGIKPRYIDPMASRVEV